MYKRQELQLDEYYAQLFPDQKVEKVELLDSKKRRGSKLAFVGDGINDEMCIRDRDVRTPQEYQEGHIPESKNVPLQQLDNIASVAKNKDIPLFVYCYSGSRSRQATGILQRMGYSKVNNIGGIAAYSGKVEK